MRESLWRSCYILGTVGVLVALPSSEVSNLSGLMQAICQDCRAGRICGRVPFAAFLIALSNVGAAGAYLAASGALAVCRRHRPFPAAGLWRAASALEDAVGGPAGAIVFSVLLFIFLGQAGTSVKGAYDVMASMTVITYFIPYLYVFARHDQIAARADRAGRDPRSRREASRLSDRRPLDC